MSDLITSDAKLLLDLRAFIDDWTGGPTPQDGDVWDDFRRRFGATGYVDCNAVIPPYGWPCHLRRDHAGDHSPEANVTPSQRNASVRPIWHTDPGGD